MLYYIILYLRRKSLAAEAQNLKQQGFHDAPARFRLRAEERDTEYYGGFNNWNRVPLRVPFKPGPSGIRARDKEKASSFRLPDFASDLV